MKIEITYHKINEIDYNEIFNLLNALEDKKYIISKRYVVVKSADGYDVYILRLSIKPEEIKENEKK